jgi:HK97 family phage prohead protease
MTVEHRIFTELRAEGRRLVGYAATFGTEARIGRFTETIRRGAFSASLSEGRDTLALIDHDKSKLLGRTRSGTLKLREDERGLAFEIALPSTQLANDVLELAYRGDLGGASFAFTVRESGERWNADRRELLAVNYMTFRSYRRIHHTRIRSSTRVRTPRG